MGIFDAAVNELMAPSGYTAEELRKYPEGNARKKPAEAGLQEV